MSVLLMLIQYRLVHLVLPSEHNRIRIFRKVMKSALWCVLPIVSICRPLCRSRAAQSETVPGARIRSPKALIEADGEIFPKDLPSKNIEFQTTMDGPRQIHRYVPVL